MNVQRALFLVILLLAMVRFGAPSSLMAQGVRAAAPNPVTIGVVEEGSDPGQNLVARIETEVRRLLPRMDISFRQDSSFNAGWDPNRMQAALQAAMDDPGIDIVLAVGALVSQASGRMPRSKPVVTTFVQRPDLFALHASTDGHAVDSNLVFVTNPLRAASDLRQLIEIHTADTIALALGEEYATGLSSLAAEVAALGEASGVSIILWPLSATARPDSVPAGIGAVMLGPTPRLAPIHRQDIIALVNSHQLVSYSLEGLDDVEAGVLLTRTPDVETQRMRRVAISISELIRGQSPSRLPVFLSLNPDLYLNGATAARIGYSPRLTTLVQATILNEDALRLAEQTLTLEDAQRMVQETNVSLAIVSQEVETSRQNRKLALSPLLPQIGTATSYRSFDPQGLQSLVPDQSLNLRVLASQMIYDDQLVSNYRSAKRLEESSQQSLEVQRLDVIGAAGESFLDMVLARLFYRVNLNNLQLTSDNLELARQRLEAGYSGPDEVFRWEAEVAKRRGDVLDSQTAAEEQRIVLNQIMGVDQTRRWRAREIEVDTADFAFAGVNMGSLLTTQKEWRAFREYMVAFARGTAPELKSLDRTIEAQSIQVGQRQRRWFLPSFSLNFDYLYQAWRDPELPGISRDQPIFSIQAEYPLFLGAQRSFAVGETKSVLEGLTQQQVLAGQLVERRTRAAIRRLESSFPNVGLTQIQAERARQNLTIVQDRYAQGLVNVTDLLEAQNESFTADLGAAAANYLFLIDLNAFQRSISWFEDDQSSESRTAFITDLQRAIQNPTEASLNPPPPQ